MDKDKVPSSSRRRQSLTEQAKDLALESRFRRGRSGVTIYPDGCILNAGSQPGNPMRAGGGKRGKISVWSAASRRRLRLALLTLAPPDDWCTFGFTGTIPGPVVEPAVAVGLWESFCLSLARLPVSMIWRLESQSRGQLHWHAIVHAPDHLPLKRSVRTSAGRTWETVRVDTVAWLTREWGAAVRRMGPCASAGPAAGGRVMGRDDGWFVDSRMALDGADRYAVQIVRAGDGQARGAWLRYLQDHASKAKQDQIAMGVGRHWGVIGRKHYTRRLPDAVVDLPVASYNALRRAYERLATPRVKDDRAPFGSRLGWRCRRGRRGRAVCFVRPDTVRRLVEWASTMGGQS